MSLSNKVLILGAGGLLGSHVAQAFKLYAPQFKLIPQVAERFTNSVDLFGYLSQSGASTVINCIGYLGTDVASHFMVNSAMPRVIADWCDGNRSLYIHFSTNAVFESHETRLWLPMDQLNPHTPYEVAKAFGEDPRAYIVRASFVGITNSGKGILTRLCAGDVFVNRKWNGVTAWELAKRIVEIVTQHHGECKSSIEHVHSPDLITFIDLAKLLGSTSQCIHEANDARLLGGGLKIPIIADQIEEYRDRFLK